jgi:hypothetical protein
MTHRRNRQFDRAVREYQRENPNTTLEQARAAVTARASQQQGTPARIPSAPLPRPGETLPGYIQRVAAAAGTHRHRAMELLGLEPGTSATQRLADLTGRLPDNAVRALTAATGMTPAQAHALTTPLPARPDLAALRRMTETPFTAGHFRRGGEGKTSTSRDLSAALARTFAQRTHMIDPDLQPTPDQPGRIPDLEDLARRLLDEKHIQPGGAGKTRTNALDLAQLLAETYGSQVLPADLPVHELFPAPYRPVIVDLDWPFDAPRPPVDPEVFDEVAKALGIGQDTDAPPHE